MVLAGWEWVASAVLEFTCRGGQAGPLTDLNDNIVKVKCMATHFTDRKAFLQLMG